MCEHSCPPCGFELDRDWNAVLNVKSRGLEKLRMVHSKEAYSESQSDSDELRKSLRDFRTPVKTTAAVGPLTVSASRICRGNPDREPDHAPQVSARTTPTRPASQQRIREYALV